MTRQWNTVAALAVVLVLIYVGVFTAGWLMGKVEMAGFKDAVQPVVMAALGYLARMIGDGAY